MHDVQVRQQKSVKILFLIALTAATAEKNTGSKDRLEERAIVG